MKMAYTFVLTVILSIQSIAQYNDYIGAGHTEGITILSSDPASNGEASINGAGMDLEIQAASRFLAQATLGSTIEDIEYLTDIGYEAWLDQEFEKPVSSYTEPTLENIVELYELCIDNLGEIQCNNVFNLNPAMFRFAWWDNAIHGSDRLRQRVALALSEILVISDNSQLMNFPHGIAAYYDILMRHAFGNYKDLLLDVTLNPSMGFYLSHINNPRTIEELNIHPDENYAREIMQLFTIGLYELNNDGTRKTDEDTGLWIPTYDNDDIQGLAKVFTGMSGSKWADENDNRPVQFGRNFGRYSLLDPMKMYEEWHEPGPKTIVGNHTIDERDGLAEVEQAIEHLFNHDNVGPFLSYRLIQRLVKSNPTVEYVDRVATVFNDNGSGERGDLKAVIKAIFMDQEAMDCFWFGYEESGQLRPPILRYTQLLIGLKAATESEKFWNSGYLFQQFTGQHPMSSPTVFNFYKPDYVPNSDFAYYDIVGPEFQILNSSTSSNYINFMLFGLMRDYFLERYDIRLPNVLNEAFLIPYVEDTQYYEASLQDPLWRELGSYPEELVDYLDILLANGQSSEETRSDMVDSLLPDNIFTPREKSDYALFLMMIHPDYIIMK